MDSSSSSSPSKYDVFLTFRSEDTRKTFVSHLYRALVQKGIRTYIDENQEARDEKVSLEVAMAIKESEIAVVVVSEHYASSVWCLSVLAKITESSMATKAVFYEVDPGDWRRLTHQFWLYDNEQNPLVVSRWKDALERLEIAAGRRFCSRNWEDDSKMIDELISSISPALNTVPPILRSRRSRSGNTSILPRRAWTRPVRDMSMVPAQASKLTTMGLVKDTDASVSGESERESYPHQDASVTTVNESPSPLPDNVLVGMGRHKKAVYELLDLECKNQVRVIGICGMEGVGKTTLAECVFEDISRRFQHHFFLTNVDDVHQNRISPSLLEHLTRTRRSNDDSFNAIKPSLVNRNLLLVVDGINDDEKVKDIVKVSHWLGPGSRVVVTTSKDEDSLVSCGVKHVHKVECLQYEEALQLFSLFAFHKISPLVGFERFSVRAVHFSGFIPLSLKVLGSFFYGKDEETWKSTLCRLEASQDNGTRAVSRYIEAREYLPRHQIELERYVSAEQGEYSPSYHMVL